MTAKSKFWVAIIIVVLTALLLLSGSKLIMLPLLESPYIPLGNVMSWLALMCLPLAILQYIFLYGHLGKWIEIIYGILLRLALVAGFAWPFIGKYLSGNWANSFESRPSESAIFWSYTEYTVLTSLLILILVTVQLLLKRFLFKGKKEEESYY